MTSPTRIRSVPAGVLGCLMLLAIGWTGLLVPSLIRSIERTTGQDDAGIGLFYLLYSISYATASFGGGPLTERLGRRTVLVAAALLHGAGIASLGLAPSWSLFLFAAIPAGLGGGGLDGGSNGLFLDLFRTGRGRAMNLLHLFFSIGALSAPLIVGPLIEAGVAWQAIMVVSGMALVPLAIGLAVVRMPSGRRDPAADAARTAASAGATGPGGPAADDMTGPRGRLSCHWSCWGSRSCSMWPRRSGSRTGWSGSWSRRR